VLVFAASDKGGTGRSVTCANIAFRCALNGLDIAYLDFDFGSPTAPAVFRLTAEAGRLAPRGMHSYLQGRMPEPSRLEMWTHSERTALRDRPAGAGRLCLYPGDRGGGEFPVSSAAVGHCLNLLLQLQTEFDVVFADLSAGRSFAVELALTVAARPELAGTVTRWLIFHRWTHQHILATADLVHGERGILSFGEALGYDREALADSIRYVRAAVPQETDQLRAAQEQWIRTLDAQLGAMAADKRLGKAVTLGSVPLEPVLQWQEQIITDRDARESKVANIATVEAYRSLAEALRDDARWEAP
jgi:hypothetical protein